MQTALTLTLLLQKKQKNKRTQTKKPMSQLNAKRKHKNKQTNPALSQTNDPKKRAAPDLSPYKNSKHKQVSRNTWVVPSSYNKLTNQVLLHAPTNMNPILGQPHRFFGEQYGLSVIVQNTSHPMQLLLTYSPPRYVNHWKNETDPEKKGVYEVKLYEEGRDPSPNPPTLKLKIDTHAVPSLCRIQSSLKCIHPGYSRHHKEYQACHCEPFPPPWVTGLGYTQYDNNNHFAPSEITQENHYFEEIPAFSSAQLPIDSFDNNNNDFLPSEITQEPSPDHHFEELLTFDTLPMDSFETTTAAQTPLLVDNSGGGSLIPHQITLDTLETTTAAQSTSTPSPIEENPCELDSTLISQLFPNFPDLFDSAFTFREISSSAISGDVAVTSNCHPVDTED
jgi:hypothetical protein